MDLSLTEQQEMMRATVEDFVRHETPSHLLTEWARNTVSFVPDLWQKAAAMGWVGMVTPQEYGGGGFSFTDAAVVFEQLGKGPLPGPFFNSGVLAPLLIMEAGTDDQKKELLPLLAQGTRIATIALNEPAHRFGPQHVKMGAERRNGTYILNGTKLFVPDAEAADFLITAVRTSAGGDSTQGITLLIVDKTTPGIAIRRLEGFMASHCEVEFQNVSVPESQVLGGVGDGWGIVDRAGVKAIPVMCAYQVGGCQNVFDFTAEYTRTRVVFSQPIGRFQRVQDHVIELSLHMDGARWTTNQALWAIDANRPEAKGHVHLAKAVASEGYCRACDFSLEVHAGVGTDKAHPLYPHLIQSRSLYPYLGEPRYHKRLMADAYGL